MPNPHACNLVFEGIVSKRRDSRYRSGRFAELDQSKDPNVPTVKRKAEEELGSASC